MEEIKTYVVTGFIALVAGLSKWWFNQVNSKVTKLEDDVSELKTEIRLNTQRDADFREHINETLKEMKEDIKTLLNR